MTVKVMIAVLVASLLPACGPGLDWGTYTDALDGVSGDAWAEDVSQLVAQLEARHPGLYHSRDRAAFRADADALARDAAGRPASTALADRMLSGVARLLASLREGHTKVNASPDREYPFRVQRFPHDGGTAIHITSIDPAHAAVNGARVLAVGGVPVEEAVGRLHELASAELIEGRDFFGLRGLADPRLLRGVGLAGPEGVTLDTTLGAVTLAPAPAGTSLRLAREGAANPALTYRRDDRWWFEREGRTVYLQYNQCSSDAWPVLDQVLALIDRGEVDRLVWDLRFNGGGSSQTGTDFAWRVGRSPLGKRDGGVIVLIGPRTFSSAIMNAVDAVELASARVAGAPLSTPVNSWGEVQRFALARTGLVIGHSTTFFDYTSGKDGLPLTADGRLRPHPGLDITPTFEAWVSGQDPVLEAALAYP